MRSSPRGGRGSHTRSAQQDRGGRDFQRRLAGPPVMPAGQFDRIRTERLLYAEERDQFLPPAAFVRIVSAPHQTVLPGPNGEPATAVRFVFEKLECVRATVAYIDEFLVVGQMRCARRSTVGSPATRAPATELWSHLPVPHRGHAKPDWSDQWPPASSGRRPASSGRYNRVACRCRSVPGRRPAIRAMSSPVRWNRE